MYFSGSEVAAILDLCTTATSEIKNNAGNEFLMVNLVRKVVLYIFLGQKVKKWLLAAILKNVNSSNCPRVTTPHPPESSNRWSVQQYSVKKKTIYSKSRYTAMAAGLILKFLKTRNVSLIRTSPNDGTVCEVW